MVKNKLAFYSGLIYLLIMLLFLGIKISASFGAWDFAGASIILKLLIQIGLLFVVPVCLYMLIFKKNFKQTFSHFGFKKTTFKSVWVSVIAGICLYFLVCYFSSVWSSLLSLIGYKFSSGASDYSVVNFILGIVLTAILPAICEETTHRGLVMNGMKKNGAIRAIVLTGLLFGLLHFNMVQFGYAFLVGMLLCLVTMISKSIIPAMIMHFLNNFLSIFIDFSQNSTWLKSGIVDFLLNMFSSTSAFTTFIIRMLIIFICLYGLVWCISSLFKEGKKLDFLTFKKNLKKEIEKNGLEKEIDINNNMVVLNLYREAHMLNLEKQLQEQKLTLKDIFVGNAKSATELVLSDNMTTPEKPKRFDYLFFYLAIAVGVFYNIVDFILHLI